MTEHRTHGTARHTSLNTCAAAAAIDKSSVCPASKSACDLIALRSPSLHPFAEAYIPSQLRYIAVGGMKIM